MPAPSAGPFDNADLRRSLICCVLLTFRATIFSYPHFHRSLKAHRHPVQRTHQPGGPQHRPDCPNNSRHANAKMGSSINRTARSRIIEWSNEKFAPPMQKMPMHVNIAHEVEFIPDFGISADLRSIQPFVDRLGAGDEQDVEMRTRTGSYSSDNGRERPRPA